jgi:hypothetical protein
MADASIPNAEFLKKQKKLEYQRKYRAAMADDIKEKYGSYFPVVRLSNKALSILCDEHQNGYFGYSEGYMPTILNHRGLSLYSIYNKESNVKVDNNIILHHRRYHQMTWENL